MSQKRKKNTVTHFTDKNGRMAK